MFEAVYKKRKNPIYNIAGWALLLLVCVIFMFVGYSPNVDFMGSASSVAEVNGDPISYADYTRYFERLQESRNAPKMTAPERQKMQTEVVDSLVNRTLLIQEAKAQGISIPEEEMRDFLMQIPQFQDNGAFSLLRYKELIRMQGLSEARFEEKVAEDMLVQKMNDLYQRVSAEDEFLDKHEKSVSQLNMNIEFIRKTSAELVDTSSIDEAAVKKAVEEKSKEIAEYYKQNENTEFKQEAQVKAQHILVKTSPEVTEKVAEEKINKIAKDLTPQNFGEMAKKFSEDPGSKDRAGDLGYFGRGRMVAEFDEAAFTQPVGKVGAPVKTSFGYHVILVTDKKDAKTIPLEEVKETIAKKLLMEEASNQAVENVNKELKENQAAQFIANKKWKWEETGVFSVADIVIPKIGEDTAVMTAAMALKPNQIAPELIKKDDAYYFVRLKSLGVGGEKPKTQNNMDIFKQIMERQKSYEMFQSWIDHLRKDAKVKINSKLLTQN
jgi:peptidyl-prolyl cis-trans isomerase D